MNAEKANGVNLAVQVFGECAYAALVTLDAASVASIMTARELLAMCQSRDPKIEAIQTNAGASGVEFLDEDPSERLKDDARLVAPRHDLANALDENCYVVLPSDLFTDGTFEEMETVDAGVVLTMVNREGVYWVSSEDSILIETALVPFDAFLTVEAKSG